MRSPLTVVLSLWLCLIAGEGVAAEIYTFGKGANGSRFVKHVDRPVATRKAEAQARESGAVPGNSANTGQARRSSGGGRTQGPPPPPPVDSRALEVLNSPIM
jgi:hypothetical protein